MVCDLPFQFASKSSLKALLPVIVDQLVEVIPTAESWALVLKEPGTHTFDKFTSGAFLAIFGGPESDPKHHENALQTAFEMQAAVIKMNESRRLRGVPWREPKPKRCG
jgi:hypothetical protein